MYRTVDCEAFITLKDHKENVANKPSCRLLNPTKPEIGKVSKQILERIIHIVRQKSGLKQWKNTDSVLNWFRNIEDKSEKAFIIFDIVNFYPSIKSDLLTEALKWARGYCGISDAEIEIILQTKKIFFIQRWAAMVKEGG